MPENFTVPMPGKEPNGEAKPRQGAGSQTTPEADRNQAEAVHRQAVELLAALPDTPANWHVRARRELGLQLGDLAGALRLLGRDQTLWKLVLELATSLGRLTPDGGFAPLSRGPLLERIKKVLGALAATDGPLAAPGSTNESVTQQMPEKPDVPYTKMLLRKLGSD